MGWTTPVRSCSESLISGGYTPHEPCCDILIAMRRLRAQATTEYMMAISVIVIAVVAAGWAFHQPLRDGMQSFSQKFETYFATEPN